ncbi:unnamed protein product [Paramecium sonneborni]|uniref:Uncharacterized protein n=1 Tax=Paramecium sonneborni TaxID=65129 RepID=A0A8S1N853_9CILI|nr:unnamed protein product [Paramecium sonneborni]
MRKKIDDSSFIHDHFWKYFKRKIRNIIQQIIRFVEQDAFNDYSQGRTYVFQLMAFFAGIILITTVPLFFFKAKSKHPPLQSASEVKNKFQILVMCQGKLYKYVVKPFGYNLEQISNVLLGGVIAELLGDILLVLLQNQKENIKQYYKFLMHPQLFLCFPYFKSCCQSSLVILYQLFLCLSIFQYFGIEILIFM